MGLDDNPQPLFKKRGKQAKIMAGMIAAIDSLIKLRLLCNFY